MLKRNVLPSRGRIQAVHAAIVAAPVAAESPELTFSGWPDAYWGFRIAHEGKQNQDEHEWVNYQVPTRSLRDLANMVRFFGGFLSSYNSSFCSLLRKVLFPLVQEGRKHTWLLERAAALPV